MVLQNISNICNLFSIVHILSLRIYRHSIPGILDFRSLAGCDYRGTNFPATVQGNTPGKSLAYPATGEREDEGRSPGKCHSYSRSSPVAGKPVGRPRP